MTHSRTLGRHLRLFDLPTTFTEPATLAQEHPGLCAFETELPFVIGKPFLRQPKGDTRVTPGDKRWHIAQRAAGTAARRGVSSAATATQDIT